MAPQDTYVVERREHIDAPPQKVRERIIDFHRWPAWSPWEELDPQMQKEYRGAPEGVGASYSWKGNRKAGEGSMEIVDAADDHVTIDLRFLKPYKSESITEFRLEPDGDGTMVTWRLEGPKTLATRIMGIFKSMDAMVGPDFEKGLKKLRADAEGRSRG